MKYKIAIFALLAFAPPSLAVQHARNVSRVIVVQPETSGAADDFLHNRSTIFYISLKLVKSDAYWYDGRSTYFFYTGWHSLVFECQHVTESSSGKKWVTSQRSVVNGVLDGGVEYVAKLGFGSKPCNVQLRQKMIPNIALNLTALRFATAAG